MPNLEEAKTFNHTGTSFITFGILKSVILLWTFGGLCINLYIRNPHALSLFFAIFLILYPIPFLWCRWQLFRYNKFSSITIDIANNVFVYKHSDKQFTFKSEDIKVWRLYEYGTTFTTYVSIIEIEIKEKEKVFISSGIGDIYSIRRFVYNNGREKLPLPEEEFGYSLRYLYAYMKTFLKQKA